MQGHGAIHTDSLHHGLHHAVAHRDSQGTTFRFHFGKFFLIPIPLVSEGSTVIRVLRHVRQAERCPAAFVRPANSLHLSILIPDGKLHAAKVLPFLAVQFKGHPASRAGHEVPPFGIETQVNFGFLFLRRFIVTAHGAQRHVFHKIPGFLGFVIHGEHPGIKFLIVAEKLLGHLLAVEQILRNTHMGIFALPEVEHPTRVGPQFVVTGIQRVLEHEHAVGCAVLHLQLLPFHGIPVRREKLHVENLAQVGQRAPVGTHDVSFIPKGVAEEITGVVQMEIHFFLR